MKCRWSLWVQESPEPDIIIIIIIFSQPAQSQQAEDIAVKERRLFGGESAAEGDRIPPLQSH